MTFQSSNKRSVQQQRGTAHHRLQLNLLLPFSRVSAFLFLLLIPTQPTTFVGAASFGCFDESYTFFKDNCYRYFQSATDYLHAKTKCYSFNKGYLVSILSEQENEFVKTMTKNATGGSIEVWIGLSDMKEEGVFDWDQPNTKKVNGHISFQKWANNQPQGTNTPSLDCAVMKADGWYVRKFGCQVSNGLPYVCKSPACPIAECGTAALTATSSSSSSGAIAGAVIAVLLVALFVGGLWYTWKYHNDKWELYVCYLCKMKESRENINSLKQENQRLRRQLTQQRQGSQISLTSGHDAIQGPSDGKGGFLPALKPMASSNQLGANHNRTSFGSLNSASSDNQAPPPLKRQTTTQSGMVPLSRGQSVMSMFSQRSVNIPQSPGGLPTRRSMSVTMMSNQNVTGGLPTAAGRGTYQQMPVFFQSRPTAQQGASQLISDVNQQTQVSVPKKKVSVIQEAEEEMERAESSASMPGETEPADTDNS